MPARDRCLRSAQVVIFRSLFWIHLCNADGSPTRNDRLLVSIPRFQIMTRSQESHETSVEVHNRGLYPFLCSHVLYHFQPP